MQKVIKYRIFDDKEFVREIELKEDSTFFDLHLAIQEVCKYDPTLMTTFYIADEYWEASDDPSKEIILERLDEKTQKDCMLMKETLLNFIKPEKGQHYLYLFDFFSVRCFNVEVVGVRNFIKKDEKAIFPICTLSEGNPPEQMMVEGFDEEFDEKAAIEDFDDFDEEEENPYYDNEFEDGYDDFGGGYGDNELY